ncbi:MAG: ABC transporter substrate-binding protein [Sphingomonadales bacterium]|nr:ABC transporter substrate-binding protein [Sphingomonadales bacterium]
MTLTQPLHKILKQTLSMALAAMFVFSMALGAMAQQVEKAQDDPEGALVFIENLSNNALAVLDDMALTQDERDREFRNLLREGFDLDYIGKLTLGRHWRSANTEQKQEFNRVFPEYVLRIYSNRLRERGDEVFEVLRSVPAGKKDVYIRSEIIRTDGPALAADWRVRFKNEEFRVVDLKIEGISMVLTQRDEFSSRINKIGMDGLIEEIRVKSKIDEVVEVGNSDMDVTASNQAS